MCTVLVIYDQKNVKYKIGTGKYKIGTGIEKDHHNNEGNGELVRQEKNSLCNPKGCDWCLYIRQCSDMGE